MRAARNASNNLPCMPQEMTKEGLNETFDLVPKKHLTMYEQALDHSTGGQAC